MMVNSEKRRLTENQAKQSDGLSRPTWGEAFTPRLVSHKMFCRGLESNDALTTKKTTSVRRRKLIQIKAMHKRCRVSLSASE